MFRVSYYLFCLAFFIFIHLSYSMTDLHIAVMNQNIEKVRVLLEEGSDCNVCDNAGNTPLHIARTVELARLLIEHKASANKKNNAGWSPLHMAAEYGDLEVIDLLLFNKASIKNITNVGSTPLHIASYHGNKKVVHKLVKAGAPIEIQKKNGKRPLDLAENGSIKQFLQNRINKHRKMEAILMTYHPRLGAKSLVCVLPGNVLREIYKKVLKF